METNEGFELENQQNEASKIHKDNGKCDNENDTSVSGAAYFKDIDLNDDEVEVNINKNNIGKEQNGDGKESR